jgi:branched-chain amino acid transport system permease protein
MQIRQRGRLGRFGGALIILAGTIVLAILGLVLDISLLSLATTILFYVVLAQGWNVLGGYVGYLNLGTSAFIGVGAYTTGILWNELAWPPFITLPLAGLVAVGLAFLVGRPTLRLRGAYFAIVTLIIAFVLQAVALNWSLTQGATGIFYTPPTDDPRVNESIFYYSFLVLGFVITVATWMMERSRLGDALRAVREDEDAAAVLGINTTRLKMGAFVVGAFLAGIAGSLHGYRLSYIEPGGMFDLGITINVVVMTILGGAGSWLGPVIGAPIVLALAEFLRVTVVHVDFFGYTVPQEINRLVLGLILVLVALFAPRGIMGLIRRTGRRRLGV